MTMLMLTMFLHHLLRRAREAKNIMHLAGDTAEQLSVDEVAIIFGFLPHQDIMRARVCSMWRDAAKKTIVPPSDFVVDSVRSYNAMRVIAAALPNLQQLSIYDIGRGLKYKYIDEEDPDEGWARYTAHVPTYDINVISNFRKLSGLVIYKATLNGRYPSSFHFPNLQSLAITYCLNLKWDLDIMSASFPLLKELKLSSLGLPRTVCGGVGYAFHSISDVPSFMNTVYLLLQRTPKPFTEFWLSCAFDWRLSKDSPDWYEYDNRKGYPQPPFGLQIIRAGSRLGWSWCTFNRTNGHSCEINWLDPEPNSESSDYGAYTKDLQLVYQRISFFRGYHEPPTAEQYRRLCDGLEQMD
ncbi:hypothetical protein QTG54_014770 [Skeletonema marinoi]|uniref:F-box domain-containing protein n=1 Tax=Skeletonema marinoi TaxID=267567 RepID=A0AAD8XVL4_9STRA|nr:hypothetical protein QTG54_014770 [Skeletonema marinoi]